MAFMVKCRKCGFEQASEIYNKTINKKDLELIVDASGKLPPVKERCGRCNIVFYADHENTFWRD